MLRWRLLLGAILIAGLLALCWLDYRTDLGRSGWAPPGGWLFPPLALVACVLGTGETLRLARLRGGRPIAAVAYLGTLAIVASNVVPILMPGCPWTEHIGNFGWPLLMLTAALLATFLGEIARYQQPGEVLRALGDTSFSFLYIGLLVSFLVQLRLWNGGDAWGVVALLSMIIVVKMGDSGAYTVGRMIGRHKMAPVISPGKTWEGFGGAMLFAVLGSGIVFYWLVPWAISGAAVEPFWRIAAYGLLVGLAGLIGDLAESLLKRDAGVKDSSDWMPGFGGVLDVLDSLLFAAPIAYAAWLFGLVGQRLVSS